MKHETDLNGWIWCDACETWVDKSELKRWTGDDALHYLCPGCDSDLVPVEILE
jgi:Zn finger protein HypA/HybF involved in hydrogenase expression